MKHANARFCRLFPLLLYIYICTTPVWKWNSIIVSDQRYPRGIVRKSVRSAYTPVGMAKPVKVFQLARVATATGYFLIPTAVFFNSTVLVAPQFLFRRSQVQKYAGSMMLFFLFFQCKYRRDSRLDHVSMADRRVLGIGWKSEFDYRCKKGEGEF